MTEQEQLRSFLAYYDGTRSRLQKAQKAYNREIRRESNPLIRNFSRDNLFTSAPGRARFIMP